MTLLGHADEEMLEAQVAFHLNVGVDLVLTSGDAAAETLEPYERAGSVHVVPNTLSANEQRTHLARLAATEHAAEWVIASGPGEFWWPRGRNLDEVLVAIPPRYTVVQALIRTFAPAAEQEFFAEARTTRDVVHAPEGDRAARVERLLRPVFRADPDVMWGALGGLELTRLVPLRAWYPIELFRFPHEGQKRSGDAEARSPFVSDTRLRDALRALTSEASNGRPRFVVPQRGAETLVLPTPDVVDDASYAVECAEVGEVDIASIEQLVDELERRIAWLEARFWPRVLRKLTRVVRR